MAVANDTADIAKQLTALPDKWLAWTKARVDAYLADQAKRHQAELDALKTQLLADHADEITALQAALAAAAPPADPAA